MHPTRWTSIFISVRQVSVVLPVESTEIFMMWWGLLPMPSAINLWARFKTPVGWWLVGGLYNLYLYIYNYRYQPLLGILTSHKGNPVLNQPVFEGQVPQGVGRWSCWSYYAMGSRLGFRKHWSDWKKRWKKRWIISVVFRKSNIEISVFYESRKDMKRYRNPKS